jgi:hypothetical protein
MRAEESLRAVGEYENAKIMFLDCLQIRKKKIGLQHLETLIYVSALGSGIHDLGRYKEAEITC